MARLASIAWLLSLAALLGACGKGPAEQAAAHRQRGEAYLTANRHREASIEFQAALQKWPQDAEAAYGLARALERAGQPGEHRRALERVLRLSPQHPGASVDLGGLAWAAGQYREALALARGALEGAPGSAEARRLEARALAALGRPAEAWAAWEKVFSGAPPAEAYVEASSQALVAGAPDQALAILREGLAAQPGSVLLLTALADLQSLLGDHAAAHETLAAVGAPRDPAVSVAQARLLVRKGDLAQGLKLLDDAHGELAADPPASARMAVKRAELLVQLGDLPGAQEVLARERTRSPEDAELASFLAYVSLLRGDPEQARGLLPLVRVAGDSGGAARRLEAWMYLLDGRSHWALEILRGLVARGDLSVDTRFLYARALADEGRLGRARAELEAVVARVPDHLFARLDLAGVLRRQREYDRALEQLDALRNPWQGMAQAQYLRARLLLEKGDARAARDLAQSFLARAPDNAGLLTLLGDAERALGRTDRALAAYERAAERAPKALEPLVARANLLEALGRGRDARAALALFQATQGESPAVLNLLASLELAGGNHEAALRHANRSLLVEPNYWASRLLRARILRAMGDISRARVELQEAIHLHPYRPEAYNLLAEIQWQAGEEALAEQTYRQLLDRVADEPVTANNLAYLCLEQDRVAEALALAERAFAEAPRSPVVLHTLGWALHRAGHTAQAEPFLSEAVAALGEDPRVLLHWGLNQDALGRAQAAREALEKVVRLAPASPAAGQARSYLGDGK
ncbi:MAG: tetratricopeptide repeat protein [Thermodesulfobacteriota bacterium]